MATKARPTRVVLDTNVIIAALRSNNPNSPNKELLSRWGRGQFVLLYSDDLLAEYVEKLSLRLTIDQIRQQLLDLILESAERIQVPDRQIKRITADPDDDVVVACAVVGKATHLVTYDPHIRVLGPRYKGVAILDALQFLQILRSEVT